MLNFQAPILNDEVWRAKQTHQQTIKHTICLMQDCFLSKFLIKNIFKNIKKSDKQNNKQHTCRCGTVCGTEEPFLCSRISY